MTPRRSAVDEVEAADRLLGDGHAVVVVDGAPAGAELAGAADGPRPLLGGPRGAARVGEDDGVAGAAVHLELVEEVLPVLAVGPAVDVEQGRVLLALLEAGGPHDPGVDLAAVGRDGREALGPDELAPGGEGVADEVRRRSPRTPAAAPAGPPARPSYSSFSCVGSLGREHEAAGGHVETRSRRGRRRRRGSARPAPSAATRYTCMRPWSSTTNTQVVAVPQRLPHAPGRCVQFRSSDAVRR